MPRTLSRYLMVVTALLVLAAWMTITALSDLPPSTPVLLAALSALLGALAIWCLYYAALAQPVRPAWPGSSGHLTHVVMIIALCAWTVGNAHVIAYPMQATHLPAACVLVGAPLAWLAALMLWQYRRGLRIPRQHLIGLLALALLLPVSGYADLLTTNGLATLILLAVLLWEPLARSRRAAWRSQ